jgi:hypothetical protein
MPDKKKEKTKGGTESAKGTEKKTRERLAVEAVKRNVRWVGTCTDIHERHEARGKNRRVQRLGR